MAAPFALPVHLFPLDFTRRRITEVDAEILALKNALSKAELEGKALKQHLSNYKYPVLTLPNEVVSEIFLQTVAGFRAPLCGRASPLYLGHICQRWRDIALSTPSLWSSMYISITHPQPKGLQGYIHLLEMWLARSRDCPLSIRFSANYNRGAMSLALATISAQRARWETIALTMSWHTLPNIQADLPLLQSLEIRLVEPYASAPSAGMAGSARAFFGPKLTSVKLYGPKVYTVGLPWPQLTSITIHAPLTDVVQILRTASSLREFSVAVTEIHLVHADYWDPLPSIPPLLHLQSLELTYGIRGRPSALFAFLTRLTLPALKQLKLRTPCIPQVVELLTRSHCPLDDLQVTMEAVKYLAFFQPDGTIALEVMGHGERG
ncbi:hypothetical protein C8R46DRAFT_48401 [Mycena filopes]|nr:hypothetical protein C8R46DRAFT_48401 [Mycena filopes]